MSNCCTNKNISSSVSNKHPCPRCNQNGTVVPTSTIYHHLKQPWNWQAQELTYYFCADSECELVYFSEDKGDLKQDVIEQNQLRINVGIKTQADNDLICYCYGVSLAEARQEASIKDFVVNMTKQSSCACETRNPSGRCCLKDFPKS